MNYLTGEKEASARFIALEMTIQLARCRNTVAQSLRAERRHTIYNKLLRSGSLFLGAECNFSGVDRRSGAVMWSTDCHRKTPLAQQGVPKPHPFRLICMVGEITF